MEGQVDCVAGYSRGWKELKKYNTETMKNKVLTMLSSPDVNKKQFSSNLRSYL